LDDLGGRPALLESMDRILAISSSNFQAADAGQISMFGDGTGLAEAIILPDAKTVINRRAQLDWERELIGLYVSDHPLSTVMDNLEKHVTHFAQDLGEAKHQEYVSVAGIVTKIRQHQTKNGKAMAFATIEDIQGMIDLVIFPNTWKKYGELIRFDEIIYVRGKADANGGETKVLVDRVSTSITQIESIDGPPRSTQAAPQKATQKARAEDPGLPQMEGPPVEDTMIYEPIPESELPPQPEFPPPDFGEASPRAPKADQPASKTLQPTNETPQHASETPRPASKTLQPTNETPQPTSEAVEIPEELLVEEPEGSSPVPERVGAITLDEDSTYLITVILKNRGDLLRDKLRLRHVYGTLISYPGNDRFAFQIIEKDQAHLLEFPNASTKISKNLINQLRDMLGRDNVQVEKYLL